MTWCLSSSGFGKGFKIGCRNMEGDEKALDCLTVFDHLGRVSEYMRFISFEAADWFQCYQLNSWADQGQMISFHWADDPWSDTWSNILSSFAADSILVWPWADLFHLVEKYMLIFKTPLHQPTSIATSDVVEFMNRWYLTTSLHQNRCSSWLYLKKCYENW